MPSSQAYRASSPDRAGLLLSGGLDSSILLGHLLGQGTRVQPFYVRTGLSWEAGERRAVARLLAALAGPGLEQLVEFDLPLGDLYTGHWSITGREVPQYDSPDEAMYLPGRNAILLLKPIVYCQLQGIGRLTLAPLGTSPFADAKPDFMTELFSALNRGSRGQVEGQIPFAGLTKREVMELGGRLPLELTFSCIAPVDGLHCGHCNKCAERQAAFRLVEREDLTTYARPCPSA